MNFRSSHLFSQDVLKHTPDDGHVGTGADAQEQVGVGHGARKARVDHDQRRMVALLGAEYVQKRGPDGSRPDCRR